MHSAVFLDRDDTLLDSNAATATDPVPGDLFDPAKVRLLPGVAQALASLARAGHLLVVFTSQGGVARGTGTIPRFEAVNDALRDQLFKHTGIPRLLTAVYACPFHPHGTVPPFNREHQWRKPQPGMITAAATEFDIDLARSWAVGDMPRDIEAATAAGIAPARCLLIGKDPGSAAPDLASATRTILAATS